MSRTHCNSKYILVKGAFNSQLSSELMFEDFVVWATSRCYKCSWGNTLLPSKEGSSFSNTILFYFWVFNSQKVANWRFKIHFSWLTSFFWGASATPAANAYKKIKKYGLDWPWQKLVTNQWVRDIYWVRDIFSSRYLVDYWKPDAPHWPWQRLVEMSDSEFVTSITHTSLHFAFVILWDFHKWDYF